MTDENTVQDQTPIESTPQSNPCDANTFNPDEGQSFPQKAVRRKRDIFRFKGGSHSAINLEHVTHIALDGKKITFSFYSTSIFVELDDEAAASSVYEVLLNAWAADVLE